MFVLPRSASSYTRPLRGCMVRRSLRKYSSKASESPNKPKSPLLTRKRVVLAATFAGAAYIYNDETSHNVARHVGLTSKRVGVVAQATVRCVYNYQRTLTADYKSEQERQEALSDCHKLALCQYHPTSARSKWWYIHQIGSAYCCHDILVASRVDRDHGAFAG